MDSSNLTRPGSRSIREEEVNMGKRTIRVGRVSEAYYRYTVIKGSN